MSENFYKPPEAELIKDTSDNEALASRWQRLWASLLDGVTIMVVTLPVMYFTGGFDGVARGVQPSLSYSLLIGALSLSVFFVLNANLLINKGQTIGKKISGIKIVDLNGKIPRVKKHLLKRYAAYFIPAQIPVVGQVLSTINILFIFGPQKRCVHDYIAGTKVVES